MSGLKLIVGNWKMNGSLAHKDLAQEIIAGVKELGAENVEAAICPPFTILGLIGAVCQGTKVEFGAQDCHFENSGAHTGDISSVMIKELEAKYVILGHSERRANHNETSELVAKKAKAAIANGLKPIICVGETEAQRLSGSAIEVVLKQVEESLPQDCKDSEIVIAYEPVWAIGTGRVASVDDIDEMHNAIRAKLSTIFSSSQIIPLLYGGSVNAGNSAEILKISNVDGALVGGASLKAPDFLQIIKSAKNIVG